jgi:hypothetical protein
MYVLGRRNIFLVQFSIVDLPFYARFGNKAPGHIFSFGKADTERCIAFFVLDNMGYIDIMALKIIDQKLPVAIITDNAHNAAFCAQSGGSYDGGAYIASALPAVVLQGGKTTACRYFIDEDIKIHYRVGYTNDVYSHTIAPFAFSCGSL